jgi:hypothetical protein
MSDTPLGAEALIREWRKAGDEHEERATAYEEDGDIVNFNRQDAYAYSCRLHADKLEAALSTGPRPQEETCQILSSGMKTTLSELEKQRNPNAATPPLKTPENAQTDAATVGAVPPANAHGSLKSETDAPVVDVEALRALPRYVIFAFSPVEHRSDDGAWVKWADVAALLPPQETGRDTGPGSCCKALNPPPPKQGGKLAWERRGT